MSVRNFSLLGIAMLAFLAVVPTVESDNVVFFLGMSGKSHRVSTWPLATALADKGHNVTFISPYPTRDPHPKIYDYVPKSLAQWAQTWESMFNVFAFRKYAKQNPGWTWETFDGVGMFGIGMCQFLTQDEEFATWMKSMKVDLVFIDTFSNECAYGIVHYWKAKIMFFDTMSINSWYGEPYGYPDETNWVPNYPALDPYYPVPMTFTQRMANWVVPIIWIYWRRYSYFPVLEDLNRKNLGLDGFPPFEEIEKNTSLIFINTYWAGEYAQALPPNTVLIGGIGVSEKKRGLSKDLDEFLKKGDGFVFVSFGTVADFLKLDEEDQQGIIGAMRNMPKMQFVWSVKNASLAQEFPAKNVYVSDWLPQQDLLAHPKIRAFVTHSGMGSIQEATHDGVPIISFPAFAEQDWNAERISRMKTGIVLEIIGITSGQLEDAINKILTDSTYTINMKRLSKLFKERPMKPLETAVWWTEFVLKHTQEELTALRPLSVHQPWWVKRQLDVWTIIIVTLASILAAALWIVAKIARVLIGTKRAAIATSSKKKN